MFRPDDGVDTEADEDGCEGVSNDRKRRGLRKIGGGHCICWPLAVGWLLCVV